jgi:preprotein translocase subunit SecF
MIDGEEMIDFMKYKKIYFLISGALLVPGVVSLLLWGLKPSIDFTGGTLLELRLEGAGSGEGLTRLAGQTLDEGGVEVPSVQKTSENIYLLKMKPINEEEKNEIKKGMAEKFGEIEEVRFETVGPVLGRELLRKTLIAVVLAAGFILAYIAYQFKDKMYGVCAILAMFHDTLILLGSFSLLGKFFEVEIDTLFVTAVLTTLSASVHDTVVTYDSIRTAAKQDPKTGLTEIINTAINRTLIRNLNNSLTIIFMLLALVLLGGSTIRWFVTALLIGTVAGTYSSTFIATPLLLVWKELEERKLWDLTRGKFRGIK